MGGRPNLHLSASMAFGILNLSEIVFSGRMSILLILSFLDISFNFLFLVSYRVEELVDPVKEMGLGLIGILNGLYIRFRFLSSLN